MVLGHQTKAVSFGKLFVCKASRFLTLPYNTPAQPSLEFICSRNASAKQNTHQKKNKSACAMQRTWQDALVLIAAWLQVWGAWSHFKPFIVNNHTISPSQHQSFQDFLDGCRRSELRKVLSSPSPDDDCISAWNHKLHTATKIMTNAVCKRLKLLCRQHTVLQAFTLLPGL